MSLIAKKFFFFLIIGYIFIFNYSNSVCLATLNVKVSRNMKVKNLSLE